MRNATLARVLAVALAAPLASPALCAAGVIGARCGVEIEQACLERIGEDVSIKFVKQAPCLGNTAVAAVFFAASLGDTAVSYDISLVKDEEGWRIASTSRRLRVFVPGHSEAAAVMLHPGVEPGAARNAIAAVLPLLDGGEAIGSVGWVITDGPFLGELQVETRDLNRRTFGGRVFCVTSENGQYVAELIGWWVF